MAARSLEPWSAAVLDADDRVLGRLALRRLPGEAAGRPGPIALELKIGKRLERLAVLEVALPDGTWAGEFSAAFMRESGASRQMQAHLSGIVGKGSEWYQPWLVEDETQPRPLPLEVPPKGENDRRRATQDVLDAFLKAVQAGESADGGAKMVWRWSRLLAQPEVEALGGPFDAIAGILSQAAPPRFDEAEEGWLGSVRLRKE